MQALDKTIRSNKRSYDYDVAKALLDRGIDVTTTFAVSLGTSYLST